MRKVKLKNSKGISVIREASKILHKWNGHLELFSRPQEIENSM